MSLVRYDTLDHSKISYKKPEKQGQIYYSEISYGNQPLLMITPKLLSVEEGSTIHGKTTTNLVVKMKEQDFKFYDCMLKMDDRNIKETCAKSKEWFGKEIPVELIDDMYKRSNKPIQRGETPTFHLKVPFVKEEPQCKVFTQYKTLISLDDIRRGSEIECVIHIRGLKFLKQHYYCDCYISQIKHHVSETPSYHIPDTCLLSDEETDPQEDDILDGEILESIQKAETSDKDKERLQIYETCVTTLTEEQQKIQGRLKEIETELHSLKEERKTWN